MKPKQQTNNDAIGEEALRLLTESGTVISGVALADMHAAKRARKARLKEVMTSIWEGFDQGLTFNGYQSKEDWAANFAKVTMRHCQHIVYGRKTDEANNRSRVHDVKEGDILKVGKLRLKVTSVPEGDELPKTKFGNYRVTFLAEPVAQPKKDHKKPLRKKKSETFDKDGNSLGKVKTYEEAVALKPEMHPAAQAMEKTLAATTDAASVPQEDCPIDEQITETTPNGYYAKLNRKPKGATQESQPWEIYLTIHGKSKFCARERSKQDAEARCWKLDRIAEEEKHNTPTTAANEAAGAAAM